jgi:hypothetical protein
VKLIGEKYDFSDRLINLMVKATDYKNTVEQAAAAEEKALKAQMSRRNAASRARATRAARSRYGRRGRDEEQGSGLELNQTPTSMNKFANVKEAEDIDLYIILKETVNFSSIDHTDKGKCLPRYFCDTLGADNG